MNLTNLEIIILIVLIPCWVIAVIYFRYILKKADLTFSDWAKDYVLDFLEKNKHKLDTKQ